MQWYCMRGLRPTSPSTTTATELGMIIDVATILQSAWCSIYPWKQSVQQNNAKSQLSTAKYEKTRRPRGRVRNISAVRANRAPVHAWTPPGRRNTSLNILTVSWARAAVMDRTAEWDPQGLAAAIKTQGHGAPRDPDSQCAVRTVLYAKLAAIQSRKPAVSQQLARLSVESWQTRPSSSAQVYAATAFECLGSASDSNPQLFQKSIQTLQVRFPLRSAMNARTASSPPVLARTSVFRHMQSALKSADVLSIDIYCTYVRTLLRYSHSLQVSGDAAVDRMQTLVILLMLRFRARRQPSGSTCL